MLRGFVFLIAGIVCAAQAQPPSPQPAQRIALRVERQDGQAWREMNPSTVFNSGDHVRFRVSANFAGYLYVMNHGTAGGYELLFPRSDTGSDNKIEASKEYVVPASQGWFTITGPAGQDVLYWLISPVDLGKQYRPLPPPPAPGTAPPPSMRPRCDDAIFKTRGECIDDSAGLRPVKPGEKLPSNIAGVAGPTPRELLFMQDQGALVVSSPAALTGPVVYELRLAHQ